MALYGQKTVNPRPMANQSKHCWAAKTMNTEMDSHKSRLSQAMSACVENGQRLRQDAEWLGSDRSATVVALCILAQEEFAKAFLLHLVCEEIIPWTAKVRESLHNHKYKQLVGLIMEWLSPSDDEFSARITTRPKEPTLPAHVADAMKLYVEKVLPQGHISCPPAASDPMARSVAGGDRDKTKQDAIYVRLSEDGEVVSVPSQVTIEMVEAELDKTGRLSDLVEPLRRGTLGPVLDYQLLVETMSFLLLDKRNRPFLILKESEFGGPITSPTGTTWLHSITVLIENISDEQATRVSGHATVFLDKEVAKPFFSFNQFAVDPHSTNRCTFFVSEDTYVCGTTPSQQLSLYINLEYHGIRSDLKHHACLWSTYDPSAGAFRETFTDSQESVIGASQSIGKSETKWRRPTTG